MCNPAWHPIWRAVYPRDPGKVYAIFCAMRDEGDDARWLTPAILKAGFGGRVDTIERILGGLKLHKLVDENGLATDLGHAVTRDMSRSRVTRRDVTLGGALNDDLAAELDAYAEAKAEHVRRLARDRQRNKRLRDKRGNVTLVTQPEEKEEDHDLLLSDVGAGARETRGEQPLGFQRKEGFVSSVMRRAEEAGLLSRDQAARLWREIMLMRPDTAIPNWGLPRRTNDELDRLDRLLRDRGAARSPSPAQAEIFLPITGGADERGARQSGSSDAPAPRITAEQILRNRDRRLARA